MSAPTTRRSALATLGSGALTAFSVSVLTASVAKCTGSAQAATIHRGAWQTAYNAWLPVRAEWDRLGDTAYADGGSEPEASLAEAELNGKLPAFYRVRDALMELPAPDGPAFLEKLEIAAESADADHIESCLTDARRLFAREA